MSKYKGLFTFDVENHRYLPVEQADGIIAEMNYRPELEPKEPLIGDDDERELVSKWASTYVISKVIARKRKTSLTIELLDFDEKDRILAIDAYTTITDGIYTIEELCGEEDV